MFRYLNNESRISCMEEEKLTEAETEEDRDIEEVDEEPMEEDDGKVHFPKAGFFIIGGIILLMIVCIILIFVFKK